MLENWRLLGGELPKLIQRGGNKQSPLGDFAILSDIGINRNQSARCQKLAENHLLAARRSDGQTPRSRRTPGSSTWPAPEWRLASEGTRILKGKAGQTGQATFR